MDIINADRVIVVQQHPAELSNGEIAVASLEELRTARLTGKRLLALWNGLPGPERVGHPALARMYGRVSRKPQKWPAYSLKRRGPSANSPASTPFA
jgi:hypothetical protein